MNVLSWIVLGFIAGVVANLIDPSPAKGGILGVIILGIAGALLGGFLGNLLFGVSVTVFNLQTFLVAIAGSLLLLFMGRVLNKT
ncbi:GlsB/YeaQ/YmgE family stress response membrane protein [Candidatus Daviesbacteria bacterium]|nr:GlsB/YeaQ/YmgE family stress response membrane protein [Candidatus Daviesbacteria bacterium]